MTILSSLRNRQLFILLIFILVLIVLLGGGMLLFSKDATATEIPFGATILVSSNFDDVQSVAIGDLDGDGDPDIIATARNANSLTWWENAEGTATSWTVHPISTTLGGAVDALAADLDGDGDLDIVGAGSTDGDILWWENTTGNGSLWDGHSIDTNFGVMDINVADVDKDGDLDVLGVAVSPIGEVAWFENTAGDGSTWIRRTVSVGLNTPSEIIPADLDGDGDIDLVVASQSTIEISWWENLNGTWTAQPLPDTYNGASGVAVADVNGDGALDVIGAFGNDNTIAWRENNGVGQGWTLHTVTTNFSGVSAVAASDLDSDGDIDILGASLIADQVRWWENTDIVGENWTEYAISTFFDGATDIETADIDQDGDVDVLGAAEIADELTVWLNGTTHRSALFNQYSPHLVDGAFDGADYVYGADIDGDGDMDILASAAVSGEVVWFENLNGNGSSWSKNVIGTVGGARSVFAADINGDGAMDALAAGVSSNDIVWWPNNGDGTFGAGDIIAGSFSGAFWVSAGDVDGDGDQDILGAGLFGNALAWWENTDGAGNFGTTNNISTSYNWATSISTADIDGDGDLDILSSAYNDNAVTWWENTVGNGTAWTSHTIDSTYTGAVSTVAMDVDKDGDLDVLGAANLAQEFSWWENTDGEGSFGPRQTIGSGFDNAESVFGADFDQDGDLDVVGAAQNDDTLAWWENINGDGTLWGENIFTTTLSETLAVHVADIDRDGVPDILSAAAVAGKVHWWGNLGGQFRMVTTDVSPGALPEGEITAMLAISVTHLGRLTDDEIELASLALLFEEEPGNGLGEPEANALIETMFLYLDDGSGAFDLESDTLVTSVEYLDLTGAFLNLVLPDNDVSLLLNPGEAKMYFLVFELTPTAGSQQPNQFWLTNVTDSPGQVSTVEHADRDIPLKMEYSPNLTAQVFTFSPDLFISKQGHVPNSASAVLEPGEDLYYTIYFSNTGSTDATDILISDVLPEEIEFTGASSSGVPLTFISSGSILTWTVDILPADVSGVITITATLDPDITTEYVFDNTALLRGTIIDATFSDTSSAAVEINLPPIVDAGENLNALGGQTFVYTTSFTDAGVNDTHTAFINWGDGTASPATVNPVARTITASHIYNTPNTYTLTVTVTDNNGSVGTDSIQVTVGNSAIYLPLVVRKTD